MKKEDFINLGLDEELAGKCEKASTNELKNYVSKTKYDEDMHERNTQLESLENANSDIEDLKKTIDTLQSDSKVKEETHLKEMHKIKLDNAIDVALRGANALNPKTVLPLLDLEKAKFNDDGTIKGLAEQLAKLSTSDDSNFLFKSNDIKPDIRGASIGESGNDDGEGPVNGKSMTYSDISQILAQNPNAKLD